MDDGINFPVFEDFLDGHDHDPAVTHSMHNQLSRASHHGRERDHSQPVMAHYGCNHNHGQAMRTFVSHLIMAMKTTTIQLQLMVTARP